MEEPNTARKPQLYQPGYDPRRVIPNNTGKRYTLKRKLRTLADIQVLHKGEPFTREELALHKALDDAISDHLLPIDRHRALNIILDRLYGKPVQQVIQESTVTVQTDEQKRAAIDRELAQIMSGELRVEVTDAEFTEIPATEFDKIDNESPEKAG